MIPVISSTTPSFFSRLSTSMGVDSILVLDGGRVREWGAQAALAADPGSRFSELLRGGAAEVLV
jgi:ABC-type multidrug transport system fused ATPase/permease subunit